MLVYMAMLETPEDQNKFAQIYYKYRMTRRKDSPLAAIP